MSEERNENETVENLVPKAAPVDWDRDFPTDEEKAARRQQNQRPKVEWMKFPKPGAYNVRLIGPAVKFLRYKAPFGQARVITHPSYKDKDPAWKAGFFPRDTYAIHVIDRADPGKLKILEKGNSIFKAFQAFRKREDINPAGADAPDFEISVEWPNGNKLQAKYTVQPKMKMSPLTAEERALWDSSKVKLDDLYKSTPLEKIVEAWEALPEEDRIPPKKEEYGKQDGKHDAKTESRPAPKTANKIVEPIAPPPESGDDLFGQEENDDSF